MTRLECEHGSLARSCQTCDLQKDIIELRAQLDDAAQCIARQAQTIARLLEIEKAARNLQKAKGRHNTEIAMNRLLETLK